MDPGDQETDRPEDRTNQAATSSSTSHSPSPENLVDDEMTEHSIDDAQRGKRAVSPPADAAEETTTKKNKKQKKKNKKVDPNKDPEKRVPLHYYNLETDRSLLVEWLQQVKKPLADDAALEKLRDEARNTDGKEGTVMMTYLERAEKNEEVDERLDPAESIAVKMFCDDDNARAFYREHNKQCIDRNWRPYQVYTTILLSALLKLSRLEPSDGATTIYRGLAARFVPPATGTRLCWKSFCSATKDRDVAMGFAGVGGTLLNIQLSALSSAAPIGELSKYDESEMLLNPFEVFEVLGVDGDEFRFKTAPSQDFIDDSKTRLVPKVTSVRNLTGFDKVIVVIERAEQLPTILSGIFDPVKTYVECGEEEAVVIPCPTVGSGNVAVLPNKWQDVVQSLKVVAATGTLVHSYDDVRTFETAAVRGLRRAVENGAKQPVIVGLPYSSFDLATDVTLLGTLRALRIIVDSTDEKTWPIQVGIYREPETTGNTDILSFLEKDYSAESKPGAEAVTSGHQSEGAVPGTRGILNVRRKCYMLAAIQVLSKTSPLTSFFRNRISRATDSPIMKAFCRLLRDLWEQRSDTRNSAVNALFFTEAVLKESGERFNETDDHDSHDFLEFLLNSLHAELNQGIPQAVMDTSDQLQEPKRRQESRLETVNSIWKLEQLHCIQLWHIKSESEKADLAWAKHLAEDDSIISDLFSGQLQSSRKCETCQAVTTTYETFPSLAIPIDKVEEVVSLQKCLHNFSDKLVFDEENLPTCESCMEKTEGYRQTKILKMPKILLMQMKRFRNDLTKVTTTLSCPITLDLKPYTTSPASPARESLYDLYGTINHVITPTGAQHYTAFIKHPSTGDWSCFDDHIVSAVSMSSFLISSDVYILFYKRREMSDQQVMLDCVLTERAGQRSKELRTVEDVVDFEDDADEQPTIRGFFARGNSETSHLFHALAGSMSGGVRFAHSYSAEVLLNYTYKDEIVIMRPETLPEEVEPSRVIYSGDPTSLSDVTDWVTGNLHGLVGLRTVSNTQQFRKPLVTVFFDPQRTKTIAQLKKLRLRVLGVARKFADDGKNIHFAMSSSRDLKHELQKFAVTVVNEPLTIATDLAGRNYLMVYKFSVRALESFASGLLDGTLKPCPKSEPRPESNDGPIKVVVRSTFDEIVNDKTKDVLIEFYSPSCECCKRIAPTIEEVAQMLKDEPDIVIAKMDVTANDVPEPYEVCSVPVVYLVRKSSKIDPERYKGKLELADITKYVALRASSPLKGFCRDGAEKKAKRKA